MSHSFECRAVDGIHIVIHGVPGRSEAGQFTIFVVWNDVDSRDTCQAIDKQMIVSDLTAYFVNKVTSVSGVVSLFPYLLVDTFGTGKLKDEEKEKGAKKKMMEKVVEKQGV